MRLAKIFLYYFCGFFLVSLAQWVGKSFDSPSLDQVIYHLHYSDGVSLGMGRLFLVTFVVECLFVPTVLAGLAALLQTHMMASPAMSRWPTVLRAMCAGLPGAAVLAGVTVILMQFSVFSWIGYRFAPDNFSRLFVDPATVSIRQSGATKNLVLIYVESLENAYGDRQIWGRDLLLPLRRVGGTSFANYHPAPGTTWTIAAMVSTQCAVPLRIVSQYGFKPGHDKEETFLPKATCLGEILENQGYKNVFLGGAPLEFAGKGQFLRDHGYHSIYGREEWRKDGAPDSAFGLWGLYDDNLFAQAKARLAELHSSGQRFNLTVLTLDTHNPYGFRSPACRTRGLRNFEDIVECTSQQTADFVEFIRRSGYLADTNVVVIGDHLAISNPVTERLRGVPQRTIFNLFISEPPLQKNSEEILPFDIFPTLVEWTGFEVAGHRLGLGYSAIGPEKGLPPTHRLDDLSLPSLSGSSTYEKLWQAP